MTASTRMTTPPTACFRGCFNRDFQAYSRIGARGWWEITAATPKAPNISDQRVRFRIGANGPVQELILVFPVTTGAPYVIESSPAPNGPWTALTTGLGTEVVGTFVFPIQSRERGSFFRVRSN